jgi:hypothetical protein
MTSSLFDPFIARGVRVYGFATGPVERVGMIGPRVFLGITPTESWSWNMEGGPVGQEWYPTRHARAPAATTGDQLRGRRLVAELGASSPDGRSRVGRPITHGIYNTSNTGDPAVIECAD